MNRRRRTALVVAAALAFLALPAAAWAHAYLRSTVPAASVTVNTPPSRLSLTFSEAVEPRFMLVSVTDANANQETAGRPQRSPANPDTIMTPLKRVPEGWYLVFWRAISADGHPVRGAFTFAVGPNAGPPPQFVIPKLTESATTPSLLTFRWLSFLALMAAVGLLSLRTLVARPLVERVSGASLRRVSLAFAVAALVGLVAIPVYVEIATAQYAFKSVWDVSGVVPLMRTSAFGRAWLDVELVLALFAFAGSIAVFTDRAEHRQRTLAALLSLFGALGAAAALLFVPTLAGHAAQTSPRGLSLPVDWLHLVAGSLWIGGLIGLLVLWVSLGDARRTAGLAVCIPRFSWVALASVAVLIGSGIGSSLTHFPTFSSLWQTNYGLALIAKIGLLLVAIALASGNLLRASPRLEAAIHDPSLGVSAARLLRRLVAAETALLVGALFAASILTSLPPPPKALASIGHTSATVGPGEVTRVVRHGPYRLVFRISPNKAVVPDSFQVTITKNGKPVRGATVTTTFSMLDMEMPQLSYSLAERKPGQFARHANALVMVGRWGLSFEVQPPHAAPFTVVIVDHASG
jgi:copper transport protein